MYLIKKIFPIPMINKDIELKVVFAFPDRLGNEIIDNLPENKRMVLSNDHHLLNMYSYGDFNIDNHPKFDPLYGKICYISGYIYFRDMIRSSFYNISEYSPYKSKIKWDVSIDKTINRKS